MKRAHREPREPGRRGGSWKAAIAPLILLLALLVAACGPSGQPQPAPPSQQATPTPTAKATATPKPAPPAPTATPKPGYPIKVYFSKHPESDNDPTRVFAVSRISPDLGVATYGVKQIIAGPTAAEKAQGYYSELSGALSGTSTCGGADFKITLDSRGTTPEKGTATVQFCRQTQLPGDMSGPRVIQMITSTLVQFPTIQRVVVLDVQGNCFADLSGLNRCLTSYPVKVYFSKHPETDSNPNQVFPVARTSPTLNVATYTVSQIIAGPTAAEKAQGYYSELSGALSGTSTCGGADFKITLDSRGTTPEKGTATVQFCRQTQLPGDMSGPRVIQMITTSLVQFPTIQRVVILNVYGNCFADLSGQNTCLKP
jgi:hypothetical protein